MDVLTGSSVAAYRILEQIGKGSMGAVYLAEDTRLGRQLAVKVLSPELSSDERFRQRFLHESQLAASLEHRHIVPIYAAGEEDGVLYLAMRLVVGTDLRRLLAERHHLEPARALTLLAQVADALDAAHAVGLVHRDVKPANVLVAAGSPEIAYLCDFGLAKHASSVDSLTGERSFVGTISYIAPEQIDGGPVGASADEYALACVLYESLTGARPFERESELQTLFAHLRDDPQPPSILEPALGEEIDAVLSRGLAKDPRARHGSCGDLIAAAAGALGVELPDLGGARPGAPRPADARAKTRRPFGTKTAIALSAAGLCALVAAVVAVVAFGGDSGPALAPHALAVFDRDSGALEWQVAFDSDPAQVIVDGRTAYVDLHDEANVAVVDLDQRSVTRRITLPDGQFMGPVLGDTMWTGGDGDRVIPVDLRYGKAVEPVELDTSGDYEPSNDAWIALGAGSVWVAYGSPPRLARIDPATREVTATILLPKITEFWCCGALAVADGDVWVADRGSGNLWRIDAATNEVVATGTLDGGWVTDIAAGDGYVWVPREAEAGVWQLDRTLKAKRFFPSGVHPFSVTFGGHGSWVANRNDGTVTRVNSSGGSTETIDVGGAPVQAVVSGKELVVAVAQAAPDPYAGLDGKVATVFAVSDPIGETDPAVGTIDFADRVQIHDAIDLKLVRYADDNGDGVQTLVPDGADVPVVADNGRTWRFKVRQGYRFSPPSNEPVTAAVFRDSIERALSPAWGDWSDWWPPGGAYVNYLEDLEGLEAYQAGKAPHISGLTIEGGDTLVFRLTRSVPDLPARLALQPYAAVPPRTPVVEGGLTEPIPSAGPYYLTSHFFNDSAVLQRNPNYPGPRKGDFDAFVFRMLVGNEAAIDLVERGDGDVVERFIDQATGTIPPRLAAGGELDRRYGGGDDPRYVRPPFQFTWFIVFNTLRPPFDDLRLRRAVSLAVDRTELAASWDGSPGDLFIPQGTTASRPQGTVYPLTSRPKQARRLAGGFTGPVTLAVDPRETMHSMALGIKRQLERIGIDVRIVLDWSRRENAPRYDMVLDSWFFDYQDIGITFGPLLDSVHSGYAQYSVYGKQLFADPAWIARIRGVEALTGPGRDEAYAKLDHDLTAGPLPLAALGHGESAWFFSDRVGCGRAIGVQTMPDLAALCTR